MKKILNENSKYGNHADDGVSKSGIAYDYVIDNNGTKVDLTKEVYNFIYKEDLFRWKTSMKVKLNMKLKVILI